jgi:hypothetical protein
LRRRSGIRTSSSDPPPCSRAPLSAEVDRRSKREEEPNEEPGGDRGALNKRADGDASARRNGKDDAALRCGVFVLLRRSAR